MKIETKIGFLMKIAFYRKINNKLLIDTSERCKKQFIMYIFITMNFNEC